MKITLIGVPIDLGSENLGVDAGPGVFRSRNITEKLSSVGFEITDSGDIECRSRESLDIGNRKLKYLDEIVRVSNDAASVTFNAIKNGEKIIAIGGDHVLCLGVISGASVALKGDLGLIYIDAHGDMNTVDTTITGNIHGMPLASLMGYGDQSLINVFKKGTKISKKNMIHVGGSDFDKGEIELIKKQKISTFNIMDILSFGLKPLFTEIKALSKRTTNIWVSLDLDAVDERYAPGVGMPNKGGLTYREIMTIADFIGKNCNVVGLDVDEFNPLNDVDGKTADLGIEFIAKSLGKSYNWYTNYIEINKLKEI